MKEFTKSEQESGLCYGVVFNPLDSSLTIVYRDMPNKRYEANEVSVEVRDAGKNYAALLLAENGHGVVTDIAQDLDDNMIEKIDQLTPEEKP